LKHEMELKCEITSKYEMELKCEIESKYEMELKCKMAWHLILLCQSFFVTFDIESQLYYEPLSLVYIKYVLISLNAS
jgi:hypothetical protein